MPVYQKFRITMEIFNIHIYYKYVDGNGKTSVGSKTGNVQRNARNHNLSQTFAM